MRFGLLGLHGFTGRGASFDPVLAHLPSTVEARCPDLLGHGRPAAGSAIEDDGTGFVAEVERLAFRAEGIGRPRVLVGYSLGARLGLALLARRPRLFAGAVLIGARPSLLDEDARTTRRSEDSARAARLRSDGLDAFLDAWESLPLFATQRRLPAAVQTAHRARRSSNTADGLARSLEILGLGRMPDDRVALGAVEIPVRLLVGDEDTSFHDHADTLSRDLPNARTVRVPGRGHDLLIEAPEAVASAIQEVAEYD